MLVLQLILITVKSTRYKSITLECALKLCIFTWCWFRIHHFYIHFFLILILNFMSGALVVEFMITFAACNCLSLGIMNRWYITTIIGCVFEGSHWFLICETYSLISIHRRTLYHQRRSEIWFCVFNITKLRLEVTCKYILVRDIILKHCQTSCLRNAIKLN